MKKFVSVFLTTLLTAQCALSFPAMTDSWACDPTVVSVSANESYLKSDIKNDYNLYDATITNTTDQVIEVTLPTNANMNKNIQAMLKSGLTFKDLMYLPKKIAVDTYNEDVGTGNIATPRKGLNYVLGSAGAVVAGVGLLGVYPQQKLDDFWAHKKIKKEYKKLSKNLVAEFTLSPQSSKSVVLLIPIENTSCVIQTKLKDEELNVYSEYHQL